MGRRALNSPSRHANATLRLVETPPPNPSRRVVSAENLVYDIESKHPVTGRLRFVEVKGRAKGADTVTITRNEMTTALNSPDEWRLAIVIDDSEAQEPIYLAHPFTHEPQFRETCANFDLATYCAHACTKLVATPKEQTL